MVNEMKKFDMDNDADVLKLTEKIVDTADKIQDHFNLFDETWVAILMVNNQDKELIGLYVLCRRVYALMNLYENGKILDDVKGVIL